MQPPEKLHRSGSANWGIASDVLDYAKSRIPANARTLETGAGHSTIFFAKQGYRHTAITPSQDEVDRIRAYCDANAVDLHKVDFIVQPSEVAMPNFSDALDFFLIDGGHGFPVPQIDWYYGSKRLKVGGILAIDDIHTWTGKILVDFLTREPSWTRLATIDLKTAFFRLDKAFGYAEWDQQPYVREKSKQIILGRKLRRFGQRAAAGDWRGLFESFVRSLK
jgi:hypothetical protein